MSNHNVVSWSNGNVDNAGYTFTQNYQRVDGTNNNTKTWTSSNVVLAQQAPSFPGEFYLGPNSTLDANLTIQGGQAKFFSYGGTVDGNITQTSGTFGVEAGDDFFSRSQARTTTITGNYTHSGGTLKLGVITPLTPGVGYDRLIVGGTYALSNNAFFQLVGPNTYPGTIGDSLEMIEATAVTGEYRGSVSGTLSGTEAIPSYQPDRITLDVIERRASVGGEVFKDLDGNGVVNDDEFDEPMGNVRVFADLNSNGVFDTGEPSAVTDEYGEYFFRLPAGTYNVLVEAPTGFEYKGAGFLNRTLTPGQSLSAQFGLATTSTDPVTPDPVREDPHATGTGYWLIGRDGGIYPFGTATDLGSPKTLGTLNAPIVSLTPQASGGGYWAVGRDGGVFAYGSAGFYGSMGGKALNSPVSNIASTNSGAGYWLVGEDGGVFAYGDAKFNGSASGIAGKAKIVGIVPTPSGNGYWLAAADGGVFAYGDAQFMGSMGGKPLNSAVVGIAADGSGEGYYLVAADGGVFAFGSNAFHGSAGSIKLNSPIVSMKTKADGSGYVLIAADGGVFAYGSDQFLGAPTGRISAPVVQ